MDSSNNTVLPIQDCKCDADCVAAGVSLLIILLLLLIFLHLLLILLGLGPGPFTLNEIDVGGGFAGLASFVALVGLAAVNLAVPSFLCGAANVDEVGLSADVFRASNFDPCLPAAEVAVEPILKGYFARWRLPSGMAAAWSSSEGSTVMV